MLEPRRTRKGHQPFNQNPLSAAPSAIGRQCISRNAPPVRAAVGALQLLSCPVVAGACLLTDSWKCLRFASSHKPGVAWKGNTCRYCGTYPQLVSILTAYSLTRPSARMRLSGTSQPILGQMVWTRDFYAAVNEAALGHVWARQMSAFLSCPPDFFTKTCI